MCPTPIPLGLCLQPLKPLGLGCPREALERGVNEHRDEHSLQLTALSLLRGHAVYCMANDAQPISFEKAPETLNQAPEEELSFPGL